MTIPFRADITRTPVDMAEPVSSTTTNPVIPVKLKGIADSLEMLISKGYPQSAQEKFLQDRGMTMPQFQTAWRLATQQPVDTTDASFDTTLDKKSGAPMKLRAAAAGLSTPDDKLALIRQTYPDAIPYRNTFVYTDPKTGRPTLFSQDASLPHTLLEVLQGATGGQFSPQAFKDLSGKAIDNAPAIGGLAGQVYGAVKGAGKGAALGTLIGPEGTIPGGVAGAVIGGAGGNATGQEGTKALLRMATGTPDPRTLGQVGSDVGMEALLGGAAEVGGQLVKPAIGMVTKAPGAVFDWMAGMTPEMQSAARPSAKVLMEYATQLGVPAGLAQTSKSLVLNGVAKVLRQMPVASDIMAGHDAATAAGIAKAVQRTADQMAGTRIGVEQGAAAMQKGAIDMVENYRTTRQGMQQVFQQTMGGPTANVLDLPNAQAMADGLKVEMARAPSVNTPLLQPALKAVEQVLSDAAPGTSQAGLLNASGQPAVTGIKGIPLDILQRARTAIGEVAFDDSPLVRADPTVKYLRDVYGSLTKDLENAAQASDRAAGFVPPKGATGAMGPAETALKTHDSYVAQFMDDGRLGNFNTFKKMAESPMGIDPLKWAVDNSKTNPKAVTNVLDQFLPAERDAVIGSIFQQMGRAPAGVQNEMGNVWSGPEFRANWDKLRLVRDQLFASTRYANTAEDIDKIYQLAGKLPRPTAPGASPGRSWLLPFLGVEAGAGMAGGAGRAAEVVVGATVGSSALAKMLSDPAISKVLLNGALAVQNGAKDLSPYLVKLMVIQRNKPQMNAPIGEYLDMLKSQGVQMPGLGVFDRLASPGTSYQPRP